MPANNAYFNNDNKSKDGLNTLCKQCRLEHRILTKDKKREYDELYRINNLKEKDAYFAKWKEENRNTYLKGKKKYNKENADRQKEWHKNWVENNRERYAEIGSQSVQRRLARKRKLPATLTDKEWIRVLKHFGNKCAYCGCEADKLEKEHFVPLSKGGEYSKENILPSCLRCNRNKSDHNFFDWYPETRWYSEAREQKILQYLGYKNNMQQLALL